MPGLWSNVPGRALAVDDITTRWRSSSHLSGVSPHPRPISSWMITLSGGFVAGHRNDLLSLIRNNESLEKQEHPLNRIMRIDERSDSIVITTTDIHLPHRIAEAIRDAYKGELEIRYDKEGYFARVEWRRES